MKLFLINVPGQPVQNAITACIFRKTHFAVYGRILNEFQSDLWVKKNQTNPNLLLVMMQNCTDVEVTKAACYDWT